MIFQEWLGDYKGKTPSGSIKMDKPKTITAEWKRQYFLAINTTFGTATGQGWYDENSTAKVSIQTPIETSQGERQILTNWSGDIDSKNATNIVIMGGPKRLTIEWQKQHQVIISLIDANSREVTAPQPKLRMIDEVGGRVDVASDKMWLNSGNYTLDEAKWHEVSVGKAGSKYTTGPNVKWTIHLEIHSANITIRSSITGLPVKGAEVVVKHSNGESFNTTTDQNGVATFPQLPVGSGYNGVAASQGISERFTFDVLNGNVDVTSRVPVLTEIVIIVVVLFGGIGLVGYFKVFRPKMKGREVPEPPAEEQPERSLPIEPKPERLEDWYESLKPQERK